MPDAWKIEFKPTAFKELNKLDRKIQTQVFRFLDKLIENHNSPRSIGAALQGKHKGLWRYRTGNYRIICEIQDHKLIILILDIGHRREIYSSL